MLAADASRLTALLVAYIVPLCSLLTPCQPGASTPRMTRLFPDGPLAELPANVLLRELMSRGLEDLPRRAELDQVPRAAALMRIHVQEPRVVGDTLRLLQVVGDDGDRETRPELLHQLLDSPRGDGIERRAGLIHQEHLGLGGNRARDAQPLLLTARERQAALLQLVLDLVPQRGSAQCLLHSFSRVSREPVQAQSERDVVVDGRRKRIRLLEDHPDEPADGDRIDAGLVDIVPR